MIGISEIYNNIKTESNDDYANEYKKTSSYFVDILKRNQNLSDDDLKLLFIKQSNGIADAGQWGSCNQEQFSSIKNIWNEIYEIIKQGKLSGQQYLNIRNIVKRSCNRDKKLIVNRVIATFFPAEVTATCKEEDFYTVANFMCRTFSDYPEIKNNWLLDNYNFMDYCRKNITEDDKLPFAVFSWKLRDAINNRTIFNNAGEKYMPQIKYTELLSMNYNLILHGAPGTGKTHLAKEIAAQMICGKSFEEIKKGSGEEKAFNEQTEFVQFHPSYDYSDFVEGLRPIEGENGEVGFERKDGIFKAFCAKALRIENTGGIDNFDEALNKFLQVMADEEDGIEIPLLNGNGTFRIKLNSYGDGFVTLIPKKDGSQGYEKDSSRFFNFNQCHRVYQGKPGYLNGGTGFDNYRKAIVKELERTYGLLKYTGETGTQSKNDKPYIFIIDEINRGEISKIFGELFFSIDPGYRGVNGKVRTQYSNMMKGKNEFDQVLGVESTFGHFFIPKNVYIIGTMNDIDRSVESMDFAMRRRFIFEEVTAEDSAENMNLSSEAKERMKRINDVIANTEGLNDAYKIGGAYFLNVDDFEKLWKIKLYSLVKEYLRGIDDDGSKYKKIEDAYFNRNTNNSSLNYTDANNPTVEP